MTRKHLKLTHSFSGEKDFVFYIFPEFTQPGWGTRCGQGELTSKSGQNEYQLLRELKEIVTKIHLLHFKMGHLFMGVLQNKGVGSIFLGHVVKRQGELL